MYKSEYCGYCPLYKAYNFCLMYFLNVVWDGIWQKRVDSSCCHQWTAWMCVRKSGKAAMSDNQLPHTVSHFSCIADLCTALNAVYTFQQINVCKNGQLLAHDCIMLWCSALYAVVHPSGCLSHGWISQKRLKLGSCNFHHRVAPWLQFPYS